MTERRLRGFWQNGGCEEGVWGQSPAPYCPQHAPPLFRAVQISSVLEFCSRSHDHHLASGQAPFDAAPSTLIALMASTNAASSDSNTTSHTVTQPSLATISRFQPVCSSRKIAISALAPFSSTMRERGEMMSLESVMGSIRNCFGPRIYSKGWLPWHDNGDDIRKAKKEFINPNVGSIENSTGNSHGHSPVPITAAPSKKLLMPPRSALKRPNGISAICTAALVQAAGPRASTSPNCSLFNVRGAAR